MNPLRSIAVKLSVLSSLCVLGGIGFMARQVFSGMEEGLIGEMKVRAAFFARQSREAIFPRRDAFSLHFHVEEILKEKAVTYAAVLDRTGKVLSHSDPQLIGVTLNDAFSQRASSSGGVELQRYRGKGGRIAYDLSAPIQVGSRRVGSVRIGFDESSLDEALKGRRRKILSLAAAATAMTIAGTIIIVGWITRPLPLLAEAVKEVGKGNFGVQVAWDSDDEVGALARAFNEMAKANSVLFHDLGEEKRKLASVFDSTREGIVLTDARGRIALINPSARALLDRQEKLDETLQKNLEPGYKANPDNETVLKGEARITEVQFERREPKLLILSGVADRLGEGPDSGGFLFIFHDATLEKRSEVLSRGFLSLVTHKLRTPLAVSLGYIEILRGENLSLAPEARDAALSKVQNENEKLLRLVEKLVTFSAAQSPENIVLDRAEASVADVVDGAIKAASGALAGPVSLRWDSAACRALPKPKIDSLLMKEVIANLIENAVKFNHSSQRTVDITAAREGGGIRICVKDNGPGIPGEEQGRLFRRFYQIEEHFTGQIPGFGLGLAFAKNVVQAHGGRVGVRSSPGHGSEFFLTLPLS